MAADCRSPVLAPALALALVLLGCGGGSSAGRDGSLDRATPTGDGGSNSDGNAVADRRDAAGEVAGGGAGGGGAGTGGGGRGAGGALDGGSDGRSPTSDGGVEAGSDTGLDASADAGLDAGTDAAPVCDPVRQTGCPAGSKCGIPPGCYVNGTVGDGQLCSTMGFDDCARPDICVGDGTGHVCRQVCNVDSDCAQPAVPSGATPEPGNLPRCAISLANSTFMVCTYACNPIPKAAASACQAGYSCGYFQTATAQELTDCEPAGAVVEGGDCSSAGCAAGLVCVNNGSMRRCRQLCRAGNVGDCDVAGDSCVAPSGVSSPMFGFCCAATGC